MSNKKDIAIKIGGDSAEFDKTINQVTGKVNNLAKIIGGLPITKLGHSMRGLTSAGTAAISLVTSLQQTFSDLTEAYDTQKKAETQLETAAKVNPYLNDYAVSKLKSFASELQSVSTYGDEELLPLMAELASAGRTQAEITEIMSAAVDVAASGTMSLDSAVKGLNSSYSGSIGTLGKTLPQVKNLTAEELKNGKAVEVVAKAFKGQAESTTKAAGGWKQFKNAYGDFKEVMGKGASELRNKVGSVLTNVFSSVTNSITSADTAAQTFKATLKAIADTETGSAGGNVQQLSANIGLLTEKQERLQKLATIDKISSKKSWLSSYQKEQKAAFDAYNTETERELSKFTKRQGEIENRLQEISNTLYYDTSGTLTDEEHTALLEETAALNLEAKQVEASSQLYTESRKTEAEALKKAYKDAKTEGEAYFKEFVSEYGGSAKLVQEELKKTENALESAKSQLADAQANLNSAPASNTGLTEADKKAIAARQEYDKTVQAKKEELAVRKEIDKTLTDEKADSELLNAMQSAYVKMITDASGALSGNADHEVQAKKEMLALSEKLAGSTENENTATADLIALLNEVNDKYGDIADIDADIKNIDAMKQQLNKLGELARATFRIDENTFDEEGWASYAEKVKAAVQQLEDEKTRLEREAQNARNAEQLELIQTHLNAVQSITSQFYELMSTLSSSLCDLYEAEAEVKTAAVEEQYANGEISAEEYEEKIEEIEKEEAEKSYKIQMWEWSANLLNAAAASALAIIQTLADSTLPTYAKIAMIPLVSATGAAQLAAIAMNKPVAPSFATGGIVQGNSYSGDNIKANVNSGEMILNAAQQKELWLMANGEKNTSPSAQNINIHNTQSEYIQTEVQSGSNGALEIYIKQTVSKQLSIGAYNRALRAAQNSMTGTRYLN